MSDDEPHEPEAHEEDEFQLVRRVFEESLDLPAGEREAFARAQCGERAGALEQVLTLLAEEPDEDFLDSPLNEALGQLVEDSDLSGKVVGDFKLIRTLGRGGMGSVYLAEQEHPRRLVALKVLEGLPSARARRRFEVESELLAGLSHPAIAQVFEAGAVPVSTLTLPYFAMEYVEEGRTLLDYARLEGLDLVSRVELFAAICDAVQYGHKKGILHRDLKPANLLVDREGRPKVIDFGIARAVGSEEGRTQLTNTGEVLGTLAYMAPERLSGDDDAGDASSDVYSLGCVLYELVSGARAVSVSGLSLPDAIRHVSEARPAPPRQHRPDLPRELNWIVMRAMEAEPDRRYASVAALAGDLRAFLRHEPVVAGPPSAMYRLQKYVRRHRVGVGVACGLVLMLTAAGLREMSRRADARRTEQELRRQEEQLRANAVGMLRISESTMLEDLQREAEDLYPMLPVMIPRYEDWLERADQVAEGLAETERLAAELSGEPVAGPGGPVPDDLNTWLRDALQEHARGLAEFLHPQRGLVAEVRRRHEFASGIEARSVSGPEARDAWTRALAAIRDPRGLYGGLDWTPQIGLLPLGVDARSGLWEFVHLLSGEAPGRDPGGELVLGEGTGIVLVLLPGGPCRMGAMLPSPEAPRGHPYVDPQSQRGERPTVAMQLDPFLVSKFEMTQGQWTRLAGTNPSFHRPGQEDPRFWSFTALNPVESVDWYRTRAVLERLDLGLPTSARWEYATRGGTTTPWWTGSSDEAWHRVDNVNLEQALRVGCYPPNPFGLHDMLGNVAEWCSDAAVGSYQDLALARWSTGGVVDPGSTARRVRGATFGLRQVYVRGLTTRSAWRMGAEPNTSERNRGVRPVRDLFSDVATLR